MIHILDQATANGIAAGEVIERPASIIKELAENSLDAGATRIQADIEGGGISYIRLADNGSGMTPEDARIAFLPHATSKLKTLQDLDQLTSMGFRGEALASIAAVAKVTLTTRTASASQAYTCSLVGGEIVSEGATAAAPGTVLEVRELFYNTPARYKFLKKDRTEAAYIQDTLERLAFSRPDVSFRFMKDGKECLLTPGDNRLLSVIYTIWGQASAQAALAFDAEYGDITCRGYISQSNYSRKNRSHQIFLVNQRVVDAPLLRAAVNKAGQGYFVKGTFPEVVLDLSMPAHLVDVNVHPQKLELRFSNEQAVFRAVYQTLVTTLEDAVGMKQLAGGEAKGEEKQPQPEAHRPLEQLSLPVVSEEKPFPFTSPQTAAPSYDSKARKNPDITYDFGRQERLHPQDQAKHFSAIQESPALATQEAAELSPDKKKLAGARIIGQIFNTYLLLEADGEMLLLDQHAAHERILYEKLLDRAKKSHGQIASQMLLEPQILKFSPLEKAAALEHASVIQQLGFDFEAFSRDSLILRGVPLSQDPHFVPANAFRALIEKAVEEALFETDPLDKNLPTVACKAAVKAHDILSYDEMKSLRDQLLNLQDPFHCPHGRPVILVISQKQLEKMFERII